MATAKRASKKDLETRKTKAADLRTVEKQLASFIDKFEPKVASLIRECRAGALQAAPHRHSDRL